MHWCHRAVVRLPLHCPGPHKPALLLSCFCASSVSTEATSRVLAWAISVTCRPHSQASGFPSAEVWEAHLTQCIDVRIYSEHPRHVLLSSRLEICLRLHARNNKWLWSKQFSIICTQTGHLVNAPCRCSHPRLLCGKEHSVGSCPSELTHS